MVNVLKFKNILFLNQIVPIRARTHKMRVGIANKKDPDHTASELLLQKQSDLGLHCLAWLLVQATRV